MKNSVRTLGITAALAMMIPLSAYAAASGGAPGAAEIKTESADRAVKGGERGARGGFGFAQGHVVGDDVLALLKLDRDAFAEKLESGLTLAEIAEEQGVSRDSLKLALAEEHAKKLEEMKTSFEGGLDKLIDAKPGTGNVRGKHGGPTFPIDVSAIGEELGLTARELGERLRNGESLKELAADKGVDLQAWIDARKSEIANAANEAVEAGKLTREQADRRIAAAERLAESLANGEGFGANRIRR
ncbi:hypothetical protein ACF3MZ_30565 [Paenibacillaceae bacterium WGS1546]|uniref:hypothetical protein n=1 Tax=Cohnella sp. WGS1546 TaxID=3366810 RepID=UPI00372D0980